MGRLRWLVVVTLAYAVLLELMLVAAVLYWPDFRDNMSSVRSLIPIPAIAEMLDVVEEQGAVAYIAVQHFVKACSTFGSAAAVLFACGAIAGEAHRGTLELLLARPQSRARILFERYAAGFLGFSLPVILTSLTLPALCALVDEEFGYRTAFLSSLHQIAFLSVVHGITFLLSTRSSNPIRIAIWVIFGVIASFALYWIKVVSRWSPFRLADVFDFLRIEETGALDWRVVAPLIAVTVVLYGAAYASFENRTP